MKKVILMCALLLGGIFLTDAYADDVDEISMEIVDENEMVKGHTKMPRRPLIINKEGYTLIIPSLSVDYTLQLVDSDGNVVFSTFITVGMTQLTLPPLSGFYEIRLVASTYYYKGYINL